jgi:uncharacterized protein (DUF58 family)
MLKNRLYYLAGLAGVLAFHSYYTGWFSWYLLLLTLCLPAFSLLCSLPAMRKVRLEAEMPDSCVRGEPANVRFFCAGRSRLPIPLFSFQFEAADQMTGEIARRHLLLADGLNDSLALPTEHCGAFACTLQKGRVYDYLCLFSLRLRVPALPELLVLPKAAPPDPLPNLSQFQSRSYKPKRGGGFSEIHDMREYRPGDSMRDIHWKLSAKTDKLIVREPQEPDRGQVLLTLDLAGAKDSLDETLDTLLWLSRWLLEHEVSHSVCWLDPTDFEPSGVFVTKEDELKELIKQLLKTRLQEGTLSFG